MIQKIIQVGNSLAVTLPKDFVRSANYRAGDKVRVDTNAELRTTYIRSFSDDRPALTPEFKLWLDDISEKEADTIRALAKV